jgi:hypothetical protein
LERGHGAEPRQTMGMDPGLATQPTLLTEDGLDAT